MPTFDVDREEITAFEFDGRYIFKQYFDNDDLFQELEQYYNADKYRFEIPDDKLPEVRQVLDNHFYDLKIADNIFPYCVVQEKEADSSTIVRNAVLSQQQENQDIFLMKDKLSVKQAVEQGASHGKESGLTIEGI